jgi:hypothetical protein
MKPIFIVDDDDALGFGLAGFVDDGSREEDAVYVVSASKADVVARLPRNAPVVVLPCRDTAAQSQ